jgi:hypothetical protein
VIRQNHSDLNYSKGGKSNLSVRSFNLSPRAGILGMKHPEKVTTLALFGHPSKARHESFQANADLKGFGANP